MQHCQSLGGSRLHAATAQLAHAEHAQLKGQHMPYSINSFILVIYINTSAQLCTRSARAAELDAAVAGSCLHFALACITSADQVSFCMGVTVDGASRVW